MVKRIPYFIELIGLLKWVCRYVITTLPNNQDLFLFRQNPCLFSLHQNQKDETILEFRLFAYQSALIVGGIVFSFSRPS